MHFSVTVFALTPHDARSKNVIIFVPLLLGGGAGKRQESGAAAGLAWAALLKDGASFFHWTYFVTAHLTSPHMPGAPLNAHLRLLSDPGPPVRSRKRKKHSETKHPPHGKWRCGRIANAVNLSARSSFNKVTSSKTRLSSIFLCRSATEKK